MASKVSETSNCADLQKECLHEMNYLAHLFLAQPSDDHRIGSILADFTVGTLDDLTQKYGPEIVRGIRHHRQIDSFTDSHQAVMNSVNALQKKYSHYAGIIVDVVFDHFLLRYWHNYTSQSTGDFFESIYGSLARDHSEFPPRYRRVMAHLAENRWLDCYRDIEKVAYALKKIGERFPRKTPLNETLVGIRQNYAILETDFLEFFPELIHFAESLESDCF